MLSKRSCQSCHRRKVKCDRGIPCSTCLDQHQICEYPQEPIRRRRPRNVPKKELGPANKRESDNQKNDCPNFQTGGHLISDGSGKSRLVGSDFWAHVEDEDYLRHTILDEGQDRPLKQPRPFSLLNSIFRHAGNEDIANVVVDPRDWQADHIQKCWELFKQNVDPAVRVLHKPSVERLVQQAINHGLATLKPEPVALIAAICYAAVVTLHPSHTAQNFTQNRQSLICQHQYGVDVAMARAGWFHSNHIQVLQAFVILLSCMSRDDDRSLWMYTGLALRVATCLGVHCDVRGTNIRSFEVDMRARLWWQLCLIDVRVSEDYGTVSSALRIRSDYPFPLNVNDSDWEVDATACPAERVGFTEMTFSLIRFEACRAFFDYRMPLKADPAFVEKNEKKVDRFAETIQSKYLRFMNNDSTDSFETMVIKCCNIYIVKLRVKTYYPSLRDPHLDLTKLSNVFLAAVELLESQDSLCSDKLAGFQWLAEQYTQWHAVAFVLSFAYKILMGDRQLWQTMQDPIDGALRAVNFQINNQASNQNRWQPLMRLYNCTTDLFEAVHIDEALQDVMTEAEMHDIEALFYSNFQNYQWQDALEGF